MLYRQVKYFVAVIDAGSFTEAAEQCYISQSAISQQIRCGKCEHVCPQYLPIRILLQKVTETFEKAH